MSNEEARGCEYGHETHDMTIKIKERVRAIEDEVKRRYEDGCKHRSIESSIIAGFSERMKKGDELFGQLITRVDLLVQKVVTIEVKLEEKEKREARNSRVLWGLVTAVAGQMIALIVSLLRH